VDNRQNEIDSNARRVQAIADRNARAERNSSKIDNLSSLLGQQQSHEDYTNESESRSSVVVEKLTANKDEYIAEGSDNIISQISLKIYRFL
jgi:hypothetical protein